MRERMTALFALAGTILATGAVAPVSKTAPLSPRFAALVAEAAKRVRPLGVEKIVPGADSEIVLYCAACPAARRVGRGGPPDGEVRKSIVGGL